MILICIRRWTYSPIGLLYVTVKYCFVTVIIHIQVDDVTLEGFTSRCSLVKRVSLSWTGGGNQVTERALCKYVVNIIIQHNISQAPLFGPSFSACKAAPYMYAHQWLLGIIVPCTYTQMPLIRAAWHCPYLEKIAESAFLLQNQKKFVID